MKFRPCIDLHQGRVKQIIGSTLSDRSTRTLTTNFVSEKPADWYADLYREDGLTGGHVIMLGPGNEEAATAALRAYPGGLQIGGGITSANGPDWLERGAGAVIVTSYVFSKGQVHHDRLRELSEVVGPARLVLDLSCRKRGDTYFVVTDRWQNFTSVAISQESLQYFARFCAEFLIHAVDVEGKCCGIAEDLVQKLAQWSPIPTTYAGGVRHLDDLHRIRTLGADRLDATIGSALDIFGGTGVKYHDAVAFNRQFNPVQSDSR